MIIDLFRVGKTIIKKPDVLDTFDKNIENFGIILKGKSIEKLPEVSKNFNDCFIVNNFDEEIKVIGDHLIGKNIVHFTNRSFRTAPLIPENYEKLGIKEIQLYKSDILWEATLSTLSFNLNTLFIKNLFSDNN